MKQTFPAGTTQHIVIRDTHKAVQVRGWNQQTVELNTQGHIDILQPEGETLLIQGSHEALTLLVPYETLVNVSDANEHVSIEQVRQVHLLNMHESIQLKAIQGDVTLSHMHGDVMLEDIQGTVRLEEINGDVSGKNIGTLQSEHLLHGDLTLTNVSRLSVLRVEGDLSLRDSGQATIGNVDGDCHVQNTNTLHCGGVGGDCHVQNNSQAEITLGNIGNDLSIKNASTVIAGHVGNDCDIRQLQGNLILGQVGNDILLVDIQGDITFSTAGNDLSIKNIHGSIHGESIGADLHLQTTFIPGSHTRLRTGGDANITLSAEPNLTIQASVGGSITGRSIASSQVGNRTTIVYGEGAATLDLLVGGNLNLRGDKGPRTSNNNGGAWMSDFAREMADFGRQMDTFVKGLGPEIASSVASEFAGDLYAQKHKSAMGKSFKKAEKNTRQAQEKSANLHIRINDREWRMDQDRVSRLVEQAQRAATEGIQGAMEAVEQALKNMNVKPPTRPVAPFPPTPFPSTPFPPAPFRQTQPVDERAQPEVPLAPEETPPTPHELELPIHIEQEREAILRMIATGRITSEEGDMLLEALGN